MLTLPTFPDSILESTKAEILLFCIRILALIHKAQRDMVKPILERRQTWGCCVTVVLLTANPPPAQAGTFRIDRWLNHDRWERGQLRKLVGKRVWEEMMKQNEVWCCGLCAVISSPDAQTCFRICKTITFPELTQLSSFMHYAYTVNTRNKCPLPEHTIL